MLRLRQIMTAGVRMRSVAQAQEALLLTYVVTVHGGGTWGRLSRLRSFGDLGGLSIVGRLERLPHVLRGKLAVPLRHSCGMGRWAVRDAAARSGRIWCVTCQSSMGRHVGAGLRFGNLGLCTAHGSFHVRCTDVETESMTRHTPRLGRFVGIVLRAALGIGLVGAGLFCAFLPAEFALSFFLSLLLFCEFFLIFLVAVVLARQGDLLFGSGLGLRGPARRYPAAALEKDPICLSGLPPHGEQYERFVVRAVAGPPSSGIAPTSGQDGLLVAGLRSR